MALVHDDDLKQTLQVGDGAVSDDHVYVLLLIVSRP